MSNEILGSCPRCLQDLTFPSGEAYTTHISTCQGNQDPRIQKAIQDRPIAPNGFKYLQIDLVDDNQISKEQYQDGETSYFLVNDQQFLQFNRLSDEAFAQVENLTKKIELAESVNGSRDPVTQMNMELWKTEIDEITDALLAVANDLSLSNHILIEFHEIMQARDPLGTLMTPGPFRNG